MMRSAGEYIDAFLARLPRGLAWPRRASSNMAKVLSVLPMAMARVHARWFAMLDEIDPRTATETLEDWENELGLPDSCLTADLSLGERQLAAHEKHTRIGGQNAAFFISLAAALGHEIEIVEFSPFVCGASECGDALCGSDDSRFYWQVRVAGERAEPFVCGSSECGDALTSIRFATDLECLFRRYGPAHAILIFSYED